MIKFSIIVPVYNVEQYICRCIDSICSQSYPELEIICINDGSTDKSLAKLNELQNKYFNIFVYSQENRGLGEARNVGVSHAVGDYIWFVDSDDWIESGAIEKLASFIKQYNSPDIVLFDLYKVIGEEKSLMRHLIGYEYNSITVKKYIQALLTHKSHYFACAKVFNRVKYVNSGFKFPKGFYEDVALMTHYSIMANNIAYLHEPIYNYYMRNGSITNTCDARILDIYSRYEALRKCFDNHKWKMYLSAFFYVISIRRREMLLGNKDKSISDAFWENYFKYQKEWKYFSQYGFFNPYIPLSMKIKILIYMIIMKKDYESILYNNTQGC